MLDLRVGRLALNPRFLAQEPQIRFIDVARQRLWTDNAELVFLHGLLPLKALLLGGKAQLPHDLAPTLKEGTKEGPKSELAGP